MRIVVNLALVTCLLLALLSSLFFISTVYSVTEVYLSPSDSVFDTTTYQLGFKFNVTAWVQNVTDMSAYQVRVYYDPTIISATAAWLPIWDPQWAFYGKTSMRLTPVLKTDYAQVGDVIYGDTPFAGTGQLAIIEFQIIRAPPKMGNLACTLGIDNADTYLIDPSGMNEIPALKTNGSYRYSWSPPPRPHLTISPTFIKQPDLMSSFDVDVNIIALDSGWGLTNATMSVTFNSSVIDILGGAANITIPANWNGPNVVNIIHSSTETVNVTVRNATVSAGNLLVATIRFTVTGHGLTDITFNSSRLNDHTIEIPTEPPVNSSVNTQQLILDIAVNDVKSPKTTVGKGLAVEINITVENKGRIPATFNVTISGNASVLGIIELTLSNGSTTILNFRWNTTAFAKGNYTLSADAWPVQDDINATNNLHTGSWIIVAMIGDVAGGPGTFPDTTPDRKVDIKDLAVIAKCYGANYPDHGYYTNYDLNSDRKVDIKDLALTAKNYGKIDP